MRSVELFAGAGGLAIGMANAGFHHAAVIENDHDACETFRENQRRHSHALDDWRLHEVDVRTFEYATVGSDIAVVSGGPPCQPFSLGGKHRAHRDERDLFPEAVRAVRELRPKAFIFENVKGLLRESFTNYFEYIQLQLSYPTLSRRSDELWTDHRRRLEQHHTSLRARAEYKVVFQLLNAADYGVPQRRERVFIVGFRSDLGVEWTFPDGTHSEDALLSDQWVSLRYWERHKVAKRSRPMPPAALAAQTRASRLKVLSCEPKRPWLTVRDAISDLPDPERTSDSGIPNHIFNPGAKPYLGHTGSPLDEPAKTLKAGDHGVPGGENMLVRPDGRVRYFTVREAARLQTFPNDFVFRGSWSGNMRQLGNAVPCELARVVAASVKSSIS
jgi:DNA (cytosine-5)-methyltransferase 1